MPTTNPSSKKPSILQHPYLVVAGQVVNGFDANVVVIAHDQISVAN
tara:strand:- start:7077 stop:7214 length:138 start_codon:yes stop_codon:yes gene_type:complete